MKYTFSEFIENKIVNEVAEYMTGDDANIEFEETYGKSDTDYTASHKTLGKILFFQHDSSLDAEDMLQASSPTQMLNRTRGAAKPKNKGYNVTIARTSNKFYGDRALTRTGPMGKGDFRTNTEIGDNIQDKMDVSAGLNKQSEFLGSHLSAIAKFIKTYSPGTLNFEDMFRQLNSEMPDIVPLMQKSLDMIARKNKLVLLNNKIMNKDALGSVNRRGGTIDPDTGDLTNAHGYKGLEYEEKDQETIDKTVQNIKGFRNKGRELRQSSIQQTNDFMNQYNSKKR